MLEKTLRQRASDGSDSTITIKFSLTAESREAGDAAERQAADAVTKVTTVLGPLESTPQAAVQLGSVVDTGTAIITEVQTFETTWSVLLDRMTLFNKIVSDIAAVFYFPQLISRCLSTTQIHPYTSLVWSVISAANQVCVSLVNSSVQ